MLQPFAIWANGYGEIDLLHGRDLIARQFKMAVEMGDEKGKVYLK